MSHIFYKFMYVYVYMYRLLATARQTGQKETGKIEFISKIIDILHSRTVKFSD